MKENDRTYNKTMYDKNRCHESATQTHRKLFLDYDRS